jgi:hypothetical protein
MVPCAVSLSSDPLHRQPFPPLRNDVKLVHLSMLSRAVAMMSISLVLNHTAASRRHVHAGVISKLKKCFIAYLLPRIHVVKPTDSGSSTSFLTALSTNFSEFFLGAIRKVAWVGMLSSSCLSRRSVVSHKRTAVSVGCGQRPWEEWLRPGRASLPELEMLRTARVDLAATGHSAIYSRR